MSLRSSTAKKIEKIDQLLNLPEKRSPGRSLSAAEQDEMLLTASNTTPPNPTLKIHGGNYKTFPNQRNHIIAEWDGRHWVMTGVATRFSAKAHCFCVVTSMHNSSGSRKVKWNSLENLLMIPPSRERGSAWKYAIVEE